MLGQLVLQPLQPAGGAVQALQLRLQALQLLLLADLQVPLQRHGALQACLLVARLVHAPLLLLLLLLQVRLGGERRGTAVGSRCHPVRTPTFSSVSFATISS